MIFSNRLGGGGFADVYKLTDQISNNIFAVKCFKSNITQEDIDKEINFFENLNKIQIYHPHIIKYYGY